MFKVCEPLKNAGAQTFSAFPGQQVEPATLRYELTPRLNVLSKLVDPINIHRIRLGAMVRLRRVVDVEQQHLAMAD